MSEATMRREVKETPLLMRPELVRATLDDIKTNTRRIVKPQPHKSISYFEFLSTCFKPVWSGPELDEPDFLTLNKCIRCPYGGVGDRLWVRERVALNMPVDQFPRGVAYWATDAARCSALIKWRPSIHMPRWASRLTLEITGVRVERVQTIRHNVAELEAEGIELPSSELYPQTNRGSKLTAVFERLWNQINGKGSWESNPWVWVIAFRRLPGADA
jgi:hypothetical protein